MPPTPDRGASDSQRPVYWTGGVVRVRGFTYEGKPLRVAAWITSGGRPVRAAIVDGHGPTVLHELLAEALSDATPPERPVELTVWPSAAAAFRGMEYPPVRVFRDEFLNVVLEDQADWGFIDELAVRKGVAPKRSKAGGPGPEHVA